MITIKPQDIMQGTKSTRNNIPATMSIAEYKRKVKFVTGDAKGMVKVWSGMGLKMDIQI